MLLSVIIPVYNEQPTIAKILKKVGQVKLKGWQKELIIVNDGSKDQSATKIKQLLPYLKTKAKNVKFIQRPQNDGKGAATKEGLKYITGDAVLIQDADLEYDPRAWSSILENFDPQVIVLGARFIDFSRPDYFLIACGVKLSTYLLNLLYLTKTSDIYTCYKLIPSWAIKQHRYQSNSFEVDIEIICKLLKQGLTIKEVPISYNPRSIAEGKKIKPWNGMVGLWTIIKYRFLS